MVLPVLGSSCSVHQSTSNLCKRCTAGWSAWPRAPCLLRTPTWYLVSPWPDQALIVQCLGCSRAGRMLVVLRLQHACTWIDEPPSAPGPGASSEFVTAHASCSASNGGQQAQQLLSRWSGAGMLPPVQKAALALLPTLVPGHLPELWPDLLTALLRLVSPTFCNWQIRASASARHHYLQSSSGTVWAHTCRSACLS